MKWAVVFFVFATFSTLLIGFNLSRVKEKSVRYFGWGLIAIGIAFGLLTIARIIDPDDPDDLEIWVTIGVLFLLVGLLSFLLSWATPLGQQTRNLVLAGGLIYVIVLIVIRFIYPSEPFIDDDGVLFFNPHGSVASLEVAALGVAILPAIFELSRHLRARQALIAKVAFTTLLVSGIILVTSLDKVLITISSVVMAAALIALLGVFALRRPNMWLES